MASKERPNGYWTVGRIIEEANKCNSKQEFREVYSTAYHKAHKLGIIDEVCKHMERKGNLKMRFVYKAFFPDGSVYIGLTHDRSERFSAHTSKDNHTVFKYMKCTNTEPVFELVSETLYPALVAAEIEDYLIEEFRRAGVNVLNKVRGGALGKSDVMWTVDRIKDEALLYISRIEFKKNSTGAYRAAVRLKCLKDVCSHMDYKRKISWTKEEILKEVFKYKTKGDFTKKSKGLHTAAQRMGVLDEVYEQMGWASKGRRTCGYKRNSKK